MEYIVKEIHNILTWGGEKMLDFRLSWDINQKISTNPTTFQEVIK